MASLKINLFASFQVTRNGRSVTDFATDKARALLSYLAVERHKPHRRESLSALLWPDQPEARARQSLRQALSNLRQACGDSDDLPDPLFLVDRHEVQINPGADIWLDVAEFTTLADACDHHHHRLLTQCLPCLNRQEAMLALYTGDFLAGSSLGDSHAFEEWAMLKREWLHGRAVEALALLADYYERRGDYAAARRLLQQQVRLEPWREEAHRQLMRLLAQDGQRSAALAQYETCRRVLAQELGVAPTAETVALYTAVRAETTPVIRQKRPETNLFAADTPLIGRAAARAELAEMIADPNSQLITLLGPGGIGKSRLAMQIAADHVGAFADGVYWAALAAVDTADLIIPTIAQAVGVTLYGKEQPLAQLTAYLREKQMLLVLDNAEHLPAIGEVMSALLSGAPDVVLLVTSRQRLALRQEWVFEVEGLALTETAVATNSPSPAAQLFIHCAQRGHHKFTPTATDLEAISAICRLVEGMPLALELAAAWVPGLSCGAIATALAGNMDLLTASWHNALPRQRSIQATCAHSWTLLQPQEKRAFAQMALFRGSFSAAAAAAVTGIDGEMLFRLVTKSLVRQVGNGRYQLHKLLHQFATTRLADYAPAAETGAARHAAYYLNFLAGHETALKGTGQEEALATIAQEIANIRLGWDWAIERMKVGCAKAAALLHQALESLFLFYALRSWYQEGANAFARAAAAIHPSIPQAQLLRGECLARQARCLEFTAPPAEATALYQESLACFHAANAATKTALPLYGLGYMAYLRGDYVAAQQYFAESVAQYRAAQDRWGQANVLSSLCLALRCQGEFARARQVGQESLAIRRSLGDQRGIASSQNNLGLIFTSLGDYAAAETALQESVAICREIQHTVGAANAYTGLCHVAASAQDYARATAYQQQALLLYKDVGDLWGIAIANNNLGQIALDLGQPAKAQTLFHEAAQGYRHLGIRSGLAHALSNLGQVSYELGETAVAAAHLAEALTVAEQTGSRPVVLEVLARAGALWASAESGVQPLTLVAFALRQPELLEETRRAATAQYALMQANFAPEAVNAAEKGANQLDLPAATTEAIRVLRYLANGAPATHSPGS